MPFDMKCNMCGVTLRLQEDQIGSIINCPSCGQVIFAQLPNEASVASETPPGSQETIALRFGLSEPELPDSLRDAATAAPAVPELAPQALAETDTVSSLAEMLGGEESDESAATKEPAPPAVAPQPQRTEAIDLSSLTPKLDIAISLDSGPPTQLAPEPASVAGEMPWDRPADESLTAANAQSIFEPEQPATPFSPGSVANAPATQPVAPELPWMAPSGPEAPATGPTPAPAPLDFTAPVIPAQRPAAPPQTPVSAAAFIPPTTPAAPPGQPEFFLTGAVDESNPAAAPAVSSAVSSDARVAATPVKPASRFGVMAAFYVSGVIFGLILGKFVFGRTAAVPGPTGLEVIRDDGLLRDKTRWIDPNAAVPSKQLKQLGETVQIVGLSITARSVERAKVTKVHSFSGSKETSAGECLVLRLLLKNTSKDVEFAPLDPMFVRLHNERERPTYSFIEVAGGDPIEMFDLHKFSEFDLEGQPFVAFKPGEEVEAIIAAAEDSPSKATGDMLWRVQVRAGVPEQKAYTTVVGFEFTPEQIGG